MRKQSVFWRILAVLSDTHFVEPLLRYQNTFVFDEISFKTSRMIQIYIYHRILVHKINIWSISRSETPYWTVKIDPFLTIFPKLAHVAQTNPEGSRIYFQGFLDPINSLKAFPGHFEQFWKNSIFWVSDVFGPELTGSHHFPKAVFANVQGRYLKTDFNIRQKNV